MRKPTIRQEWNLFLKQCSFYGFSFSTLTFGEFMVIHKAGLGQKAYEIGCDMSAESFPNITEAIEYYKAIK